MIQLLYVAAKQNLKPKARIWESLVQDNGRSCLSRNKTAQETQQNQKYDCVYNPS